MKTARELVLPSRAEKALAEASSVDELQNLNFPTLSGQWSRYARMYWQERWLLWDVALPPVILSWRFADQLAFLVSAFSCRGLTTNGTELYAKP